MTYVFNDNVLLEIQTKTNDIFNYITIDINHDDFIKLFKNFHLNSRINDKLVKNFINKRLQKLKSKNFPFYKYFTDLNSIKLWTYLHIMYLLYENSFETPNHDILVALVKHLDDQNIDLHEEKSSDKSKPDLGNIMKNLLSNMGGEGGGLADIMKNMTGEGGGLADIMKNMTGDDGLLSKIMKSIGDGAKVEGQDINEILPNGLGNFMESIKEPNGLENIMNSLLPSLNKIDSENQSDTSLNNTSNEPKENVLKNIIKDIKNTITTSENDLDKMIESTKDIGIKYHDMISEGKLSIKDLISGMTDVLKNPSEIEKEFKDFDHTKLPDPDKILNKIMSDFSGKNVDTGHLMDMVKSMTGNSTFDPLKIINSLLGSNTTKSESDTTPLTEEQFKEMEEYYSNLKI